MVRILTEDEVFAKPTEELKTVMGLGWNGRRPDPRDWSYRERHIQGTLNLRAPTDKPMPLAYTLQNLDKYMPVINQGEIGSCTGCSSAYFFQWMRRVVPRSILQLYYEIRRRQGWENEDSGGYIRDAFLVLRLLGAGRASWWPYDESKFTIDPPVKVDRDALARKLMDALWLENRDNTGNEYRHCIADKAPFCIGFTVFSGFMRQRVADYGIYSMPDLTREYVIGGHAVVVVGYDDNFPASEWARNAVARGYPAALVPEKVFIIRNSWGPGWGRNGDVAMDARFIGDLNYADDAWTGRNVVPAQSGVIA